jgi:anti-anti-sigma factor
MIVNRTATGEFVQTFVVVAAPTEVDAATADDLRALIREASAGHPERVLVDFAGVTFVDSAAVSMLADEAASLRQLGCRLQVRDAPRSLRRLADLTGLSHRIGLPAQRSTSQP